PKSVYYTPDGRFLVLPLLSGTGADVLYADTLEKVARLEPPRSMAEIQGFVECAFFPDLGEIWISQMHNSLIHVFDLATLAYKESFPSGGSYPKVIASSPDGRRAYVTNWVSEDLSVFDAGTRSLLAKVKLGGTPRGLATSPDGKVLYVARFSGGSILRVRLDDLAVETFWPADGGAKRSLALDASRGRLYATDMDRGSLFVLDLGTGRLVAEVPLGWNPNGLALSPDGSRVYACTRGPNGAEGYERPGPLAGELVAVDAESLAVVGRQWGGNQLTGLAVAPDGKRLVFTDFLDRRVEAYDTDMRER
ncbi:MAG TPA: YncE family protein, partial [Spirochaetia bacterium]|nr:YncE family protein [Spirochaetia bacterium]